MTHTGQQRGMPVTSATRPLSFIRCVMRLPCSPEATSSLASAGDLHYRKVLLDNRKAQKYLIGQPHVHDCMHSAIHSARAQCT